VIHFTPLRAKCEEKIIENAFAKVKAGLALSDVEIARIENIQIFKYSNIQIFKYSKLQSFKASK
jgi:hypothetical protein